MSLDKDMVMVIGLANRCPFHEVRQECPLRKVREKPLKERYEFIRSFTSGQIRWIIDSHHECSTARDDLR